MRQPLFFVIFILALTRSAFGQPLTIATVAGRGWDLPGLFANSNPA
jgi:hypothetical protein